MPFTLQRTVTNEAVIPGRNPPRIPIRLLLKSDMDYTTDVTIAVYPSFLGICQASDDLTTLATTSIGFLVKLRPKSSHRRSSRSAYQFRVLGPRSPTRSACFVIALLLKHCIRVCGMQTFLDFGILISMEHDFYCIYPSSHWPSRADPPKPF